METSGSGHSPYFAAVVNLLATASTGRLIDPKTRRETAQQVAIGATSNSLESHQTVARATTISAHSSDQAKTLAVRVSNR